MKFIKRIFVLFAASLYLGLSGDHLAIFSSKDPHPLQILPYASGLFSKNDVEALEDGIPFSSAAELSRLLEDYTS